MRNLKNTVWKIPFGTLRLLPDSFLWQGDRHFVVPESQHDLGRGISGTRRQANLPPTLGQHCPEDCPHLLFAVAVATLGKSKQGLSNGGLKATLCNLSTQSATIVHICGLL